jgi:hypothetical protein
MTSDEYLIIVDWMLSGGLYLHNLPFFLPNRSQLYCPAKIIKLELS